MSIRMMEESDLPFVVGSVQREGWLGETEQVFRTFMKHEPGCCMIGEVDGRPVAMCVGVPYERSAFVGELIVSEELRGRGLGRQLLEQCLRNLRERKCESVYLDGDVPAVRLYERLGFKHLCRSLRFLGSVAPGEDGPLRPMSDADMDSVAELDRLAFGEDRRVFLESRLEHHASLCLVLEVGDRIAGYIMGQPGHGVVSVGPWLVGESCSRPLALLEGLARRTDRAKLRIGVLESNTAAVKLLRSVEGLVEGEACRRMVLGRHLGLGDSPRLFAIGSAAKG